MKTGILKLNTWLIFAGLLFAAFFLRHYGKIIVYPFQGEYREGTAIYITHLLLNYNNPFSIEAMPTAHTLYGVLYNLFALPVVKFFSMENNLLLVHRSISAIFLFSSVAVIFNLNRINGCKFSTNLALSGLFLGSCFMNGAIFMTVLAQPATMGLFFMLLSVYFPIRYRFRFWSLFSSAVLSVFCVLTKQYFATGFILVSTYCFLFESKLRSIYYVSLFAIMLAFTNVIIQHIFPLYFAETFYLALTHYADIPGQSRNFFALNDHTISQLVFFAKYFSPLLLSAGIIYIHVRKNYSNNLNLLHRNFLSARLNQPLFMKKANIFVFSIFVTLLIFYFELGKNVGAWMEYLIQLTLPFVVLFVGQQESKLSYSMRNIVNILILINVYILLKIAYPAKINKGIDDWNYFDNLIANHHDILASPAVTSILLNHNKSVYLTGQTDYAFYILNEFAGGKVRALVPASTQNLLAARLDKFQNELILKIKNKKYDLVILDNQDMLLFEDAIKILKENYVLVKSTEVKMTVADQHWNLDVYVPKKGNH